MARMKTALSPLVTSSGEDLWGVEGRLFRRSDGDRMARIGVGQDRLVEDGSAGHERHENAPNISERA